MKMTKQTKEAIRRAMVHHEHTNLLYLATEQPVGSGHAWRVRFTELDEPLWLSWREAYVLTVALAHAERAVRR